MTAGGDFMQGGAEEAPSYPTLFGIKLTPTVSGIAIAVLGGAASFWLLFNVVQPAWQQNQELTAQVNEKRSQLVNQEEIQQQIKDAQTRLAAAEKLKADVLTLFATEESLDTLLYDLNERVQFVNTGISTAEQRATLSKFVAVNKDPEVITDSSLGAAANGVLQRQVYTVEMRGNFAQTQSIIRNIERLQPLLIVRNFRSEIDPESRVLRLDAQGRTLGNQPIPRLITSFELIALMPAPTAPPVVPAPADPNAPPADPNASPSPAQ
ncbi:MAG TPA: pilus assembly protein PilO [Chroococcidiopsis sp.]